MEKNSNAIDRSDGTQRDLTLRTFIDRVEAVRELKQISGANWDLEIGAITEVSASLSQSARCSLTTSSAILEGSG